MTPLALFAFNRPQCLRQLLDDLANCTLIEQTDIHIFIDGVRSNEDTAAVGQTRNIAEQHPLRQRAASVSIVSAAANRGLATSVIDGVSGIITAYGRIIVLEDDLRLTPNFLVYMNRMLDRYADDERIFQIAGFGLDVRPPHNYEADVYFHLRPTSWGWGTWLDRWQTVDWQVSDFDALRRNPLARWRFNRGGSDMYGMLRKWHDGQNDSWAIRFAYSMHRQHRLAVTPVFSLTRNDGFGSAATHCEDVNFYRCRMDDGTRSIWRSPSTVALTKSLSRQAAAYYSLWSRFLNGRKWRRIRQLLLFRRV